MFEQTFKNIDDLMWREAGCASELDFTEQKTLLKMGGLPSLENSYIKYF
jgi:type I restriction enzyme M protein